VTPRKVSPKQSAPAAVNPARPLLALLTDFGTDGWYVGVMKGVIKGICPGADIVDISHGVAPHSVIEGAMMLWASYRNFPEGTVFVAVVDPGVGTRREPIVLRAAGRWFVAPNNGILGYVTQNEKVSDCRHLCNPRYFLPEAGSTFDGRDIFAPAAAHLAAGVPVADLAPERTRCFSLASTEAAYDHGVIVGNAVYFDHFGNAITNIPRTLFEPHFAAARRKTPVEVVVGRWAVPGIATTYADVRPGEVLAYWGSLGMLEIGVNHGSARDALGIRLLDKVTVRRTGPRGE
jgi:S-adenosyl-L-methionine hydrolase (adenosine-forming)